MINLANKGLWIGLVVFVAFMAEELLKYNVKEGKTISLALPETAEGKKEIFHMALISLVMAVAIGVIINRLK